MYIKKKRLAEAEGLFGVLTKDNKTRDIHMSENYYNKKDLSKFPEIGRVNKNLADKFFAYYEETMGAGALSEREKALIALAVSHALKCPYCIDAYTSTSLQKGATEEQMNEAVHVAAAMAAGITLVHSVQMNNHIDSLSI